MKVSILNSAYHAEEYDSKSQIMDVPLRCGEVGANCLYVGANLLDLALEISRLSPFLLLLAVSRKSNKKRKRQAYKCEHFCVL